MMYHPLEEALPHINFIVKKLVHPPNGSRPTFKHIPLKGEVLDEVRLACKGRKTLRERSIIKTEKYVFTVAKMQYEPSLDNNLQYTCYLFASKR